MKEYIIVTDSTIDITQEMVQAYGITVLPLSFRIHTREYKNYLDDRGLPSKDFYNLMREGNAVTTAKITVDDYIDQLRPILASGKDVFVIAFSSKLSGTFNSFCIAREHLNVEFPDRIIIGIDSRCASMGAGLLVHYAYLKKQEGVSIFQLNDYVRTIVPKVCHWFTVDNAEYLSRSGKVKLLKSFFAKKMKINPVLHVNDEGMIVLKKNIIGRKKAIIELLNQMEQTYIPKENETIFISHGDCIEEANELASMIKEKLNVKNIIMNYLGPVNGAHSGPGTIAVFYIGKTR